MNKIENIVYNLVKSNPRLKKKVRNLYQSFFDLLPRKANLSQNSLHVKEGYFFGFHDISPFSHDDCLVLANKLTIPLRMPESREALDIGYFSTNDKLDKFIKLTSTKAWNYHKGCRLQWLDQNSIIFNDIENENLVSKIRKIGTDETNTISYPIDTASPCGKFATSFDYARLEVMMPGYGYRDFSNLNDNVPNDTGLFLIDLESNCSQLIISINDLVKIGLLPYNSPEHVHYITHSLFSHDGRYISFLHRWATLEDIHNRKSRLVVYDRYSEKIHVSPTNGMVSHYVWNCNYQIIAYCRIGNIDSHVLFKKPDLSSNEQIAYPKLNSDGHQSFASDKNFVTDTYPDKYRMAKLYLVNVETNDVSLLASLNSPKKFQSKDNHHWACDLHPRMNRSGDMVCFDSVHTNKRALCFMKVKKTSNL